MTGVACRLCLCTTVHGMVYRVFDNVYICEGCRDAVIENDYGTIVPDEVFNEHDKDGHVLDVIGRK